MIMIMIMMIIIIIKDRRIVYKTFDTYEGWE